MHLVSRQTLRITSGITCFSRLQLLAHIVCCMTFNNLLPGYNWVLPASLRKQAHTSPWCFETRPSDGDSIVCRPVTVNDRDRVDLRCSREHTKKQSGVGKMLLLFSWKVYQSLYFYKRSKKIWCWLTNEKSFSEYLYTLQYVEIVRMSSTSWC